MLQQQRRDDLPLAPQIIDRGLARPHQVAHGLVPFVGYPDRGQLSGPQQASQLHGVAAVGLHPVACLARDQRWRDDGALMSEADHLPVQTVARRAGFITDMQLAVPGRQPRQQLPHRLGAGLDLADVAHLATSPGLGDRHRVLQLCCVDADENCANLRHGSSSMR